MSIVQLSPPLLIARGGHRACYRRPTNRNLCVKIHHSSLPGALTETKRELHFYCFIAHKQIRCRVVPHYYGTVSTNLGEEYVYERIADFNRNTSKTLEEYLNEWVQSGDKLEWLASAWRRFRREAQNGWLVTKKLHPWNLMVRSSALGNKRIMVVDNLGSSAWLATPYYSHWLARLELYKRFKLFERLIYQQYHYPI